MRQTLRRSCGACAKSKHSCDLRTPCCSRCIKRKCQCIYANEPLTRPTLNDYKFGLLDPFDSYPQTRLPREHVQRLIHSFLYKIAFQYYPLDLDPTTNPFLVSWWPLALRDPALFHVSLQTACLDEELLAEKGFEVSDILMADSVALLRHKVSDTAMAVQDETMAAVITLATIEFGKGNIKLGEMHIDGVRKLVNMRGGINSVRQTSLLAARMISWVSLLIMGHPQFDTQNDVGIGLGIPPIPEWQTDLTTLHDKCSRLGGADVEYAVRNVLIRLRIVFQRWQSRPFPTTQLHDLTCFTVHRLLHSASDPASEKSPPLTECLRNAIVLYMLIIQGPTYYSHAVIRNIIVARFAQHLERVDLAARVCESLDVWLFAVGTVASAGTVYYHRFTERGKAAASSLQLRNWDDVFVHIKHVLWLNTVQGEDVFRSHWDDTFYTEKRRAPLASTWNMSLT